MTLRHTDRGGARVGCWRPTMGTPWTRLASGDSRDEALANLQEALVAVRGGEQAIQPAGRTPDRPPSVFARRFL